MQTTINNYKYKPGVQGSHDSTSQFIRNEFERILNGTDIREVIAYFLMGERHGHVVNNDSPQKMMVFFNGTYCSDDALETLETKYGATLPHDAHSVPIMLDDICVAGYHEKHNTLNIYIDMFYKKDSSELFSLIINQFYETVIKYMADKYSWTKSPNKDTLTRAFEEYMIRVKQDYINRLEQEIYNHNNNIKSSMQNITENLRKLQQKERSLETEKVNNANIIESIKRDLDAIVALDKVEDVTVKENVFSVFTKDLLIYASNGKVYHGGKFKIDLDPRNSDIRFFGGIPTQGYWTQRDPHPHVNGGNGQACLGSISSTVAELSAQMQIYALTLIAIDFLEAANTSDPAGRKVTNWKEVVDEVTIDPTLIVTDGLIRCPRCENMVGELYPVYNGYDIDDNSPINYTEVCEDCREDYYFFDDDTEEYILNGTELE